MKRFIADIHSVFNHIVKSSSTHVVIGKKMQLIINYLRIFIISGREFVRDRCQEKASALTFYTLLSVVPVAAMAFGLAKGFGFDDKLREQLATSLEGHEEVAKWVTDFAMSYLENTKGGVVAGIGFGMVLWAVMNVLGNIESSFNDIWKINRPRSFIRKFSDYISIMLIAILFLVSSGSVIVIFASKVSQFALLKYLGTFVTTLIPYVLVWISFTMVFFIMPNTRVKFGSALFGGIISGTLFQLLQFGYIYFQVGVSNYNAIYGSFAALPLFLIWLHWSWHIVLLGAEISFAHQNAKSLIYETDSTKISYNYKRLVALMLMHKVVINFKDGKKPLNSSMLSVELKLPIRLVKGIVYELVECNLLSAISIDDSGSLFYQPAYDINMISVGRVIDVLHNKGYHNVDFDESEATAKIRGLLESFDLQLRLVENEVCLKDI